MIHSYSVAILKRINVTNIQGVQEAVLEKKKFPMSSRLGRQSMMSTVSYLI